MATLTKSSKDGSNYFESNLYKGLSKQATGNIYNTYFDYLQDETKKSVESSFYTLDIGDILWKIQLWRENMPCVRPFFVKTNSDPHLLRFLTILGLSFDCASEGELKMVMEAGADPKNVIFAHTIKTPRALKYAEKIGVDLMTFDSEEELLKIHKFYPKARLLLRLIPQDVKCAYDLSGKFGCHPEDALRLLMCAKELNLHVMGISFHVGGLCQNPKSYTMTIQTSRNVFDLAQKLGFRFSLLDIGGGFTGAKGVESNFKTVSQEIKTAMLSNFPESTIDFIAEPGTFFVASAGILITNIIGKKKIIYQNKIPADEKTEAIERFYYLNDSIYCSFFSGVELYGMEQTPLLKKLQMQQRQVFKSTLWGQSCCGNDVLLKECFLPDMEEGEYLVWYNMGAYCQVLCSCFCGIPIPPNTYIFIQNVGLNMEWLPNLEAVKEYILNVCTLINEE